MTDRCEGESLQRPVINAAPNSYNTTSCRFYTGRKDFIKPTVVNSAWPCSNVLVKGKGTLQSPDFDISSRRHKHTARTLPVVSEVIKVREKKGKS